ncbi:unnamed protein product [Ambrosiozyma monospora]|uniref:Unnamed protein product n=1 Tax=Ambrosiozyma monospora TaxID=43982 RepID=A0ACB5T6I0_AMBMO|nr:unnamed protein product [Ambrosiozyma monospora]
MPPKRKQTIKLTINNNKKQKTSANANANHHRKGKQRANSHVEDREPSLDELHVFLHSLYNEILHFKDPATEEVITGPFVKLPPKKIFPDYYQIIETPISLHEIKAKIKNTPKSKQKHFYTSLSEFTADFKLMADNANQYNDPESLIAKDAINIYEFVASQVHEFQKQLNVTANPEETEKEQQKHTEFLKAKAGADQENQELLRN